MALMRGSLRDRLYTGFDPEGDSCWEWTKGMSGKYGSIWVGANESANGRPKTTRAHIASWYVHTGKWPEGLVCHHCDNPVCVRPAHLYDGTPLSNNRDTIDRDRRNPCKGENHKDARLTEQAVIDIWQQLHSGATIKSIAAQHSVHVATIADIKHARSWQWLTKTLPPEKPKRS